MIAWVACPWVVAGASGWLAALALGVLVGLPAVFSTPGDKKRIIVATPGPLRVLVEIVLHAAAVVGAWAAWPTWLAALSTVVVIAAIVIGIPRTRWLLRGAPEVSAGSA